MGQETTYEYIPQKAPRGSRRVHIATTAFGGMSVQGHKGLAEDTLSDMANLSPRGGQDLTTRRPRGQYRTRISTTVSRQAHGIVFMDDWLFVAEGPVVYRVDSAGNATACAVVTDNDKDMTVFGDQVIILPDKKVVGTTGEARSMELDTGVIDLVEFCENTIILPSGTLGWEQRGFQVGDMITVSKGAVGSDIPAGQYVILGIFERTAYVDRTCIMSVVDSARIRRIIPDFKRLCVSGNRLYGFVGKDIYVSAVNNPYNWSPILLEGGRGGAVLRDDTEGEFTACAAWQGYVVFFKSDRICKLMGSDQRNYSLVGINAPGIPVALADTLCSLGGYLYYHGASGVYRYGGQHPAFLGKLQNANVLGGMGGTDGLCYYLAVNTSGTTWQQYVYAPDLEAWFAEDDLHPKAMVSREGKLFEQDTACNIWVTTSDGRDTGCAVLESMTNKVAIATFLPDHAFEPLGYRLTGLYIRATADRDSSMHVLVAYADSQAGRDATSYKNVGTLNGKAEDRLFYVPLKSPRCQSSRLRFALRGRWDIHAIIREYEPLE